VKTVRIRDRLVGPGQPVFVIAEIGYNFNTIEEAKSSIDAALDCKADAVKFQTFRAATVTSRYVDFPEEAGSTNQYEEFERYEMSEAMHKELFDHARSRGLIVFSTPAYYDDVDLLDRLDSDALKIGSDDLTNLPFLQYVAQRGRPVIFSTGMATTSEVAQAFDVLSAAGNDRIIVLYCVSNYPIKDISVLDLNVIPTYARSLGIPVGFSDHTTTMSASLAAVALGASVIERHFTLDKNLNAPDASFSSDPSEMKALVQAIRELETALGDGIKRPAATEWTMRSETRKSVIARKTIAQGEIISEDMIIVKRPGNGIPPSQAHLVIGRRAKTAIAEDHVVTWDHIE
jgi:N,N'-diacetyllegionaminate synthase